MSIVTTKKNQTESNTKQAISTASLLFGAAITLLIPGIRTADAQVPRKAIFTATALDETFGDNAVSFSNDGKVVAALGYQYSLKSPPDPDRPNIRVKSPAGLRTIVSNGVVPIEGILMRGNDSDTKVRVSPTGSHVVVVSSAETQNADPVAANLTCFAAGRRANQSAVKVSSCALLFDPSGAAAPVEIRPDSFVDGGLAPYSVMFEDAAFSPSGDAVFLVVYVSSPGAATSMRELVRYSIADGSSTVVLSSALDPHPFSGLGGYETFSIGYITDDERFVFVSTNLTEYDQLYNSTVTKGLALIDLQARSWTSIVSNVSGKKSSQVFTPLWVSPDGQQLLYQKTGDRTSARVVGMGSLIRRTNGKEKKITCNGLSSQYLNSFEYPSVSRDGKYVAYTAINKASKASGTKGEDAGFINLSSRACGIIGEATHTINLSSTGISGDGSVMGYIKTQLGQIGSTWNRTLYTAKTRDVLRKARVH